MRDFLGITEGNALLRPYLSSDFSLSFSRSFGKRLSALSVNVSHQITQEGSILETLNLTGNERFFSYTQVDAPSSSSSIAAAFFLHRKQNRWNLFFMASQSDAFISDGSGELLASLLRSLSLSADYSKNLGKKSDINFKNTLSRADFGRAGESTTNYNWQGLLKLRLAFASWQFRPEVETNIFQFTTNPLVFIRGKASLRYRKRHSPWSFECQTPAPLSGRDLFSAQQSSLFYSEAIRRVQPSYVLLSVGYVF